MLFGKKREAAAVVAPLNYWEEQSVFIIIPRNEDDISDPAALCDRIEAIPGVKFISQDFSEETGNLSIEIAHFDKRLNISFYPMDFSLPNICRSNHFFPDIDIELIEKSTAALYFSMKINGNILDAYHLQLKLSDALVHDALAVYDESAEKLLSGKWVSMVAASSVPPAPSYLYTIHAVTSDDSSIWLHTHGLCRCGLSELEILESNKEVYGDHANIINIIAGRCIDDCSDLKSKEPLFVGDLNDNVTLVCTTVPWNEALCGFDKDVLGGINDRGDSHNTRSSVIFVYPTKKDADKKRYSKLSIYDGVMKDNPIYMISTAETNRMRAMAAERINFVKDYIGTEDCKIMLKIGLTVDDEYSNLTDRFENIWFVLLEYSDSKFIAKLSQEPYYIKNMHEGDIGTYTADQITDWCIYKSGTKITPDTAYLLEYLDS
ncbi:MAG: DUF4026 domain-containing protein [Clostridia bacterium]|nr:DUF4026 domain-containing protein [Clostridia bacterium]